MSHRCLVALLLFIAFVSKSPGANSESLPLYDVDDAGFDYLLNSDETYRVEAPTPALNLREVHHAYERSEWRFQIPFQAVQGKTSFLLEVVYTDSGAGVIQPTLLVDDQFNGRWAPPDRAASFTRLNSRKERRAWFEFSVPDVEWERTTLPHLKITGLQHLRKLSILPEANESEWKALENSVPVRVDPLVELKRPMELNCTVGIEDVGDPPSLERSLANIREYAPLARLLGFTSIECFVRWDMLEPRPGEFDFSHYDAITAAITERGLKWFPNLVITSAFALPNWYFESEENVGMVCLEHGELNQVPSIWNEANRKHVSRVLHAFGEHYEPMGVLEAVRLGPSGNFGEAQYPAGAGSALGYKSKPMHAHIGWWCGDAFAVQAFQDFLRKKYKSLAALNDAWESQLGSFEDVRPSLPQTYRTRLGRFDLTEWYTDSMTEWCDFWAVEARSALPGTRIYQSSGGWGFRETGTDFSAQTKSMAAVDGGIRLTNETDSFEQNFYATRLSASAARLYGTPLGYEPAGYHSARGVVARFFSSVSTHADNLYTRHLVLFNDSYSVDNWLKYLPLLDRRSDPLIDVAVFYPETMNQIDDGAFRHLYAWGFNPRAAEIRRRIEVDFLDERLIRDGFLDRYKVLVFCWGNVIPQDVLNLMDEWTRKGGTAIFPTFPRGDYISLEGDRTTFQRWERGDVGQGAFHRFRSDMEPISLYGDYVESILRSLETLSPATQRVLRIDRPPHVFLSALASGDLLTLNYSEEEAEIRIPDGRNVRLEPMSTTVIPLFLP